MILYLNRYVVEVTDHQNNEVVTKHLSLSSQRRGLDNLFAAIMSQQFFLNRSISSWQNINCNCHILNYIPTSYLFNDGKVRASSRLTLLRDVRSVKGLRIPYPVYIMLVQL